MCHPLVRRLVAMVEHAHARTAAQEGRRPVWTSGTLLLPEAAAGRRLSCFPARLAGPGGLRCRAAFRSNALTGFPCAAGRAWPTRCRAASTPRPSTTRACSWRAARPPHRQFLVAAGVSWSAPPRPQTLRPPSSCCCCAPASAQRPELLPAPRRVPFARCAPACRRAAPSNPAPAEFLSLLRASLQARRALKPCARRFLALLRPSQPCAGRIPVSVRASLQGRAPGPQSLRPPSSCPCCAPELQAPPGLRMCSARPDAAWHCCAVHLAAPTWPAYRGDGLAVICTTIGRACAQRRPQRGSRGTGGCHSTGGSPELVRCLTFPSTGAQLQLSGAVRTAGAGRRCARLSEGPNPTKSRCCVVERGGMRC